MLFHIIECLMHHTACKSTVTDDGNGVSVRTGKFIGHGKAKRCRDGSRAMPCTERIMRALTTLGKAGKSAALAQHIKTIKSARQHLVHVALMSHVPNDMIPRRIKDAVQCHAEFHNAKVRRKVSAVFTDTLNQKISDLFVQAKYRLLVKRLERLQIAHLAKILIFGHVLHTLPSLQVDNLFIITYLYAKCKCFFRFSLNLLVFQDCLVKIQHISEKPLTKVCISFIINEYF